MRLFVGVPSPPEWRQELSDVQDQVGDLPDLRWVPPEKFHLTLVFLGSVASDAAAEIEKHLLQVAALTAPFELHHAHIGPSPRPGHMLWTHFADQENWYQLVNALREQLKPFFSRQPVQQQIAHITLARSKKHLSEAHFEGLEGLRLPQSLSIAQIALYQSHLGQDGSSYQVLGEYPLKG